MSWDGEPPGNLAGGFGGRQFGVARRGREGRAPTGHPQAAWRALGGRLKGTLDSGLLL